MGLMGHARQLMALSVSVPQGVVGDFVPEGLNDRSQAIYCLEQVQSRIRPVGHGLILTHG
jgi:hypothetical protein